MTDPQLWEAIAAGDETCYKQLFYQYYGNAVSLAFRYLGEEEAAKDIAQDLFYKLWAKRTQITIQKDFRVYINQAIRNACLNHLKKLKQLSSLDDQMEITDDGPSALEILQSNDLQEEINRAISAMPPACRAIFLMRRMEGLSLKEIALQLDISTKTVENQITKAGKLLAKMLISYQTTWLLMGFIFCYVVGDLLKNNVF